jgi:hypothetical protein
MVNPPLVLPRFAFASEGNGEPDKFDNYAGESEADVGKVLVENWIRLFEMVWK